MHKKFPRMIFAILFSQSPILPEHFTEKAPFASDIVNMISLQWLFFHEGYRNI